MSVSTTLALRIHPAKLITGMTVGFCDVSTAVVFIHHFIAHVAALLVKIIYPAAHPLFVHITIGMARVVAPVHVMADLTTH